MSPSGSDHDLALCRQFYIASISVHALILAVNQFVSCFHNEWKECSIHTPPATVILLLFLIFEGALFGIFTLVMLCSQVQAIWTDETVRPRCRGADRLLAPDS